LEILMTETTTSAKSKASATKTTEFSEAVREEVLASVKQAQQFTIDAVNAWVDAVGKVVPQLPSLPFAPARADAVEGVAAAFEAAEELLATQRKFVSDLVAAFIPAS
jgi:hypothetical protein